MTRCLFAYTAAHGRPYPEYLNVSEKLDGTLVVTMRAPPHDAQYEGATLCVEIPSDQRNALLRGLMSVEPVLIAQEYER